MEANVEQITQKLPTIKTTTQPQTLAGLVETCRPYWEHLGITPAWIDRWARLKPDDRANSRAKLDNWLAHYLDACLLLRAETIDPDAARALVARWPSQMTYYARTQHAETETP